MECKRNGDTLVIRLAPGEELVEQVRLAAKQAGLQAGSITGIGATNRFEVGIFNSQTHGYHALPHEGFCEIASLTGNLSTLNGEPYLHLHMAAADKDGKMYGGHLVWARIYPTAEIFIHALPQPLGRKYNEEIGINELTMQE